MNLSNADHDLADRLAERERSAGVARIRATLTGTSGRLVCNCGEPIPEARRQAVPHTDKCTDCAARVERLRRRA